MMVTIAQKPARAAVVHEPSMISGDEMKAFYVSREQGLFRCEV
jgi:hypothetical protein